MEASVAETQAPGKSGVVEIGALVPELQVNASFPFDFGSTVEEAIQKFGPDVVLTGFIRANIVTAQGTLRSKLRGTKDKPETRMSPEDAAKWMADNWKPTLQSTKGTKKSAEEKYFEQIENMSEEERKDTIAKLKAKLRELG